MTISVSAKLKAGDTKLRLKSGGNTTGSVTVSINGVATTAFTVPGGQTVVLNSALVADSLVVATYADNRVRRKSAEGLVNGGAQVADPDYPTDTD